MGLEKIVREVLNKKTSRRDFLKGLVGGLAALAAGCKAPFLKPSPTSTPTATSTPLPTHTPTPSPTSTPTHTPTATQIPIPSPEPVDSNYDVLAVYIHGLGITDADLRNGFKYATIEPIYGLKQNALTMMTDIKHARENGITTFVMPSAFPHTTWEERRFKDIFLRINNPPFEIEYSLMFNPLPYFPYLFGSEPPYPLEVGVEKDIKEFIKPQFSDIHYKKVDGKPLVFLYAAGIISYFTKECGGLDRLERVVDILRKSAGEDIFLVGDVMVEPEMYRYDRRVNSDPHYYERVIKPFDAIWAYYLMRAGEGWLMKGNTPYVVKPFNTMIDGFKLAYDFWGEKAHRYGSKLIPLTMPTGVSNQRLFDAGIDNWLVNRHKGVSYDAARKMAEVVKSYVDPTLKMVTVNAYNEIQEGAAALPSKQFGFDPIHSVRDTYAIRPERGWPKDYYPHTCQENLCKPEHLIA